MIEAWIILSLIFTALMRLFVSDRETSSSLWFLDPLLSIVFLLLMTINRRFQLPTRLRLSRLQAAVGFVLISWLVSMLYEATLSQGNGRYGGMHEKTIPSFLIAQGFYIPLAVFGLWLVRRYHITFFELFFVAGMTGIYEATVFGIPAMLSAMFLLSPTVIAYYFVVYSRFLSMGLLLIDEEQLWDQSQRKISFARKLVYGALLGFVCWACFILWGETMQMIFDNFQSFAGIPTWPELTEQRGMGWV